jgi:hypothetical protein
MYGNDETKVVVAGEPWKNEGYFDTFEEADRARKQIKANDRSGLLALKVKRSGPEGKRYVVKSREDAGLKAQLEEIEEKMVSRNSKKKG